MVRPKLICTFGGIHVGVATVIATNDMKYYFLKGMQSFCHYYHVQCIKQTFLAVECLSSFIFHMGSSFTRCQKRKCVSEWVLEVYRHVDNEGHIHGEFQKRYHMHIHKYTTLNMNSHKTHINVLHSHIVIVTSVFLFGLFSLYSQTVTKGISLENRYLQL